MAKWVNPETRPASEIPDVRALHDRCVQILNTLIPLSSTESLRIFQLKHTLTCTNSDRCCLKTGAPSMNCGYYMIMNGWKWMSRSQVLRGWGVWRVMWCDAKWFTLIPTPLSSQQNSFLELVTPRSWSCNWTNSPELCRKQLKFENGKVTVINSHFSWVTTELHIDATLHSATGFVDGSLLGICQGSCFPH